jgi:hypothetical protein
MPWKINWKIMKNKLENHLLIKKIQVYLQYIEH